MREATRSSRHARVGRASPVMPGTPGRGAAAWLECTGCGYRHPDGEPVVPACPRAVPGDDIDHVLARRLDPALVSFPGVDEPTGRPGLPVVPLPATRLTAGADPNPFVRYRRLLLAWHAAVALGWSDAAFVSLVERLDRAVAQVDGGGFRATPFARSESLSERLGCTGRGGVWVKDETGGVSGSHKARHLMGTLIELEVADQVRRAAGVEPDAELPPLAIASCGNAALAAAVVARAGGRQLDVFIPTHADPAVVARLRELGARLQVCERMPGVGGDPTYLRLLEAVAGGAVPFTCQGNLNGLAIEGGETLGYEMVSDLIAAGRQLDHLVVQVGGGALASACIQAFVDARALGVPIGPPRVHVVQTQGGYPLVRAYERVAGELLGGAGGHPGSAAASAREHADRLRAVLETDAGRGLLRRAARHRSGYMWPWEEEPHSLAGGILDDETYDWHAVVQGVLASGGSAVVVDEATIAEANELARTTTGIDVDHTGSAGLAGLLELRRDGRVLPGETVALLFTGRRRGLDAPAAPNGALTHQAERSTRS